MSTDMTSAQFAATRDLLGLSAERLATELGVNPKTIWRMEHDKQAVLPEAAAGLREISQTAEAEVAGLVADLLARPTDQRILVTYPDDYRPFQPWAALNVLSARYHRSLCARVALQVPGVQIYYAGTVPHRWGIWPYNNPPKDRAEMWETSHTTYEAAAAELAEGMQTSPAADDVTGAEDGFIVEVDPQDWEDVL